MGESTAGGPPDPLAVSTVEELTDRLRALRAWADISYREVHRRVIAGRAARGVVEQPVFHTVYNCFQPGRTRLDVELVVDIVRAVHGEDAVAEQWRQACRATAAQAGAARIVRVTDEWPREEGALVGRTAELRRIVRLSGSVDTSPVVVIHGMAGIGKTRLAVEAGRIFAAGNHYKDLRLFVNLHGYDEHRPPAEPEAVLDAFLRRLGVPGHQIQHLDRAGRTAKLRQLLAGRNALILLDNAVSADQVRPILPGGSGCLVLVTSRSTVRGLSVTTHIGLAALTTAESLRLLRDRLNPGTIDGDPESGQQITRLLGNHPLALALAANRIRSNPEWTLADHVDRLERQQEHLKLEQAVETAFDLSYRDLPKTTQRLFRLAALHPGDNIDTATAASMLGLDHVAVHSHFDRLAADNLVHRDGGQRVRFHDLVRIYATQRAYDEEPARERNLAISRLLDHYVRRTKTAVHSVYDKARPGADSDLSTPELAKAWLDAEDANLMAIAQLAAGGWDQQMVDLAWTLWLHLDTRGRHADALVIHRAALTAAQALGDRGAELRAQRMVGTTFYRLGDYDAAIVHLNQALAMARECGDRAEEAFAVGNLGVTNERLGRYAQALDHYHLVLEAARRDGTRLAESIALDYLGFVHGRLGHHDQAREYHLQALEIAVELGSLVVESYAAQHLGIIHERTGSLAEAEQWFRRALRAATEVDDPAAEAYARSYLGVVHQKQNEFDEAIGCHERSLAIAADIGERELEIHVLNHLGHTLRASGNSAGALQRHSDALALATRTGDRYEQACAHHGITAAHEALGRLRGARSHAHQAVTLYRQLGVPAPADPVLDEVLGARPPDEVAIQSR